MLKEANHHKRRQKPRYANADQINAVSELVMNTLRGAIRPGRHTVKKLKPYSKQLRLIAIPRQSIKRRRQLLSQQIGAGVWRELKRCYHCAKSKYHYENETSLVATSALCHWRIDDCAHPVEKSSPTYDRKISQEVGVQKRISMPLGLWCSFIAHHGRY